MGPLPVTRGVLTLLIGVIDGFSPIYNWQRPILHPKLSEAIQSPTPGLVPGDKIPQENSAPNQQSEIS